MQKFIRYALSPIAASLYLLALPAAQAQNTAAPATAASGAASALPVPMGTGAGVHGANSPFAPLQ